jgi:DNA-directed RNA polymerase subunit RPC12/RpoP
MNENVGHEESTSHQNRYIRCPDCGEQIMMVPDVTQMIEAIENHISTHKVGEYPKHDPIMHPKAPIIREDLTEQVLMRAAEIGGTLSRNQTWINTE